MATTMVNFRMDSELKEKMEKVCKSMGLTMSTAFTIFATRVIRDRKIPFEIEADPFYSEENMNRLRETINNVKNGKSTLKEHELVEVDDEEALE